MSPFWLALIVVALGLIGFFIGRARSVASAGGDPRKLHSRPGYYGHSVLIATIVPALIVLCAWLMAQPIWLQNRVVAEVASEGVSTAGARSLIMSDIIRIATGLERAEWGGLITSEQAAGIAPDEVRTLMGKVGVALAGDVKPEVLSAAQDYMSLSRVGALAMTVVVLGLAAAGFVWGLTRINMDFRARNSVEHAIRTMLIACASLAILTTVGIVLSLIFNTAHFFRLYPASEFFLGTTWSPSFGGGSELGIIPLLWGTLYISIIALAVAVPIGLFAAIYLSEYATPRVRSIVKPLLEVLAGIPTIVYGLFALIVVGPLLLEIFGPNTVGWMQGGTAVMTAGLVMGIMLIPFVSSLSDDIINAVPQSLRDGSYGMGATQSETIRQVVLPAALPGIVGAILLAASRAIGETMIVVLGAGAAARLSLNPFEAMTTITAKIVSQLTGDADFASPEALVAFSLGMTLFVITLGLNIFALWIVRKYREQYE